MTRNLFIGDLHIGHRGVSEKFRTQFSSDEEHDEIILDNVASSLRKRDTLWLLGDICFKVEKFKLFDKIFKSCQTTNIILGNHCHQAFPRFCLDNYTSVNVFGLQKKFGCWITHAPIHEDELYRAHCVYGHTHNKVIDNPRYLCVSCEQVDFKPVTLEFIRETFTSRGVPLK